MQPTYRIRLAQADELPLLNDIEEAASILFQDTHFALEVDQSTLPISLLRQQQKANLVWVAADTQDNPVGFAVALLMDDHAHLHELSVHPVHGRKGLGTALTQAVIQFTKDAALKSITLSTFRDIPWNAPFYAKLGFREVPEDELGNELKKIQCKEADAGLPIAARIIMQLTMT